MHIFDHLFLQNALLPAELLNITTDIYTLRVMALDRKEQYIDVFTELEAMATVKGSNEMEGIVTTDERIFGRFQRNPTGSLYGLNKAAKNGRLGQGKEIDEEIGIYSGQPYALAADGV